MLHIPLFDALKMSENALNILYNEAERQRALDTIATSKAFGGDNSGQIEAILQCHVKYTEGETKRQLGELRKQLRRILGK